jgi:HD-GYP domain-containing protein (c-di-GMP phosphodiesterase class II)
VLSRIVSIVDSYDAIATVRPYHAPKSHLQVMRMLADEQGRKYDPHVLATFSKVVESSRYRAAG